MSFLEKLLLPFIHVLKGYLSNNEHLLDSEQKGKCLKVLKCAYWKRRRH